MFFEERVYFVRDAEFAGKTEFNGNKLTIDKQSLIDVLAVENVISLEAYIAKPGDNVRIVNVMDGFEPRVQADGNALFPGFLNQPVAIAPCKANCLRNVAVLTTTKTSAINELFDPKQAIVDMSGPGTSMSFFSGLINIVIEIKLSEDISDGQKEYALRMVGIKAADYLARTTLSQNPEETYVYKELEPVENLPKLAAMVQIGGEGELHDNSVYGRSVMGIFPTQIDITEMFTGAIVGGVFTYGCQRNYTYCYQNSALLKHLYEGHGKTHSFAGVVISRGYNQSQFDKLMAASYMARLMQKLGVDGVIIAGEGAGNAHVDIMLSCQQCELLGIKTVVLINEIAGPVGTDPGLVNFVKEATSIVSVGNRSEIVDMPEMPVIGGQPLVAQKGRVLIPARDYCGATSEIGQWNIGAQEC